MYYINKYVGTQYNQLLLLENVLVYKKKKMNIDTVRV